MTHVFNSRYYLFGITHEGKQEFLHTTLDSGTAISFLNRHRKVFGKRYKEYFHKTMSENDKEHYLK